MNDKLGNQLDEAAQIKEKINPLSLNNIVSITGAKHGFSCTAIDSRISRLAAASDDFTVQLFDFNGMATRNKQLHTSCDTYPNPLNSNFPSFDSASFESFTPVENTTIKSMDFSKDSKLLLIIPNSSSAKIYNKNGEYILGTAYGDKYLRTMTQTQGHTTTLTGGSFSSLSPDLFYTSSLDGTLRQWNIAEGDRTRIDQDLICQRIFMPKDSRGARLKVSAFGMSKHLTNKFTLAAGCVDNTIQLWNASNQGNMSTKSAELKIHVISAENEVIKDIKFSSDDNMVACRTTSELLLYDLRMPRDYVFLKKFTKLENLREASNIEFSPCGKYLLTSYNARTSNSTYACLGLLDLAQRKLHRLKIKKGISINSVKWLPSPKSPQIFISCSDSTLRVLFSTETHPNLGIHQSLSRYNSLTHKRKTQSHSQAVYTPAEEDIFIPNALPMFAANYKDMTNAKRRRRRQKHEMDVTPSNPGKEVIRESNPEKVPIKKNDRHEMWLKMGYKPSNEVDAVYKQFKPAANILEQDPRAELLRYAGDESESTKVLASKTMEQEEREAEE